MKENMKESELAEKFITFFSSGYDVYPEVPAYGIIDIVAYRAPVVIAVECKMQFGFDVLEQAVKNKSFAHYSYIAIPKPKTYLSGLKRKICQDYGVGVLTYSPISAEQAFAYSRILRDIPEEEMIGRRIEEVVKPAMNRRIIAPKLKEWMKRSVAGSQNERMTAFKFTVEQIEDYVRRKGGTCKVEEVLKNIPHHYSGLSSAKSSLAGLCRSGVIKTFRMEDGQFKLTA